MKRRGFTILLTLLVSMSSIVVFAYDANVNGIYYNFSGTEATVTCLYSKSTSNSSAYSGNVVIPETVIYNGTTYYVTNIDGYAFFYCSGLTSVTIGNSVAKASGTLHHTEKQKVIDIPRFLSVLHSDLLNKV